MFSANDFFDSEISKTIKEFSTGPCTEHEIDPKPIQGRAEGLVFTIFQFRPAFALQAYLRFARAGYIVKNIEYASVETAGRLPILIDGQYIVPEDDVLPYLAQHYPELDIDARLPGAKKAQIEAFTALVQEKLAPALRASQYRDERNYMQNIRSVILRATRFPLGALISLQAKKRAIEEQHSRGLMEGGLGLTEIMVRAQRIYKELDNWLGASTGDFIFGREPTSFDAILFGHLMEAFADLSFLVFLPAHTNLVRFFKFIAEQYFASNSGNGSQQQQQQGSRNTTTTTTTNVLLSPPDVQTRDLWARADYVNSKNAFNQVEGARICVEAPLVPEPVVQKFLEGDGWDGQWSTGKKKAKGGVAGGGPKSKAEAEEEAEQRKQNVLWLSIVGGVAGLFLLLQGIVALVDAGAIGTGNEEEGGDDDDDDNDDDGDATGGVEE